MVGASGLEQASTDESDIAIIGALPVKGCWCLPEPEPRTRWPTGKRSFDKAGQNRKSGGGSDDDPEGTLGWQNMCEA